MIDGQGSGSVQTVIRSHAAGSVLYRYLTRETAEICVFKYRDIDTRLVTTRLPMGTQLVGARPPETFMKTFTRELQSEALGLFAQSVYEEFTELVYWTLCHDQRFHDDPDRNLHLKAFKAVMYRGGQLRTMRHEDLDRNDKREVTRTEILDPPFWIAIDDFISRGRTPLWTIYEHWKAVVGTLHKLADLNRGFAEHYAAILTETEADYNRISRHTPEERSLVASYLGGLDSEAARINAEKIVGK